MRLLPLLLLASCFSPLYTELELNPDPELDAATHRFAIEFNGQIDGDFVRFGDHGIHVRMGGPECGHARIGAIEVSPDCEYLGEPDVIECIIAHEAGHSLGLEHSKDPASIMWPRVAVGRPLRYCVESLIRELVGHGNVLFPPNAP